MRARVVHLRGTLASRAASADILRGALTWLASRSCSRSERFAKDGEPARSRTENQQIKSLLLCQLSYGPEDN